ncbi:MAG: elongation factor G [candidate division WOR-3 bacterium]
MKEYSADKIRNIGFFGHSSSGKTSVADTLIFLLGTNPRRGKVDDGTSFFDYDEDEINRKVSINLALGYGEYNGFLFNLIDTPGYADFLGDVLSGIRACDCGCVIIDGTGGIEVGTEIVMRHLSEENKPMFFFINKLKKEHSDFFKVLEELNKTFPGKAVPLFLPIGKEMDFKGLVDIMGEKVYLYENGKRREEPLPEEKKGEVSKYREKIIEGLGDVSEEILNKYLEGSEITKEEIISGLKEGIKKRELFPILAGDANEGIGVDLILDFACQYLPSPLDCGIRLEDKTIPVNPNGPPLLFVFKTVSELHIGDLHYCKVLQGKVSSGDNLLNMSTGRQEKINQIYYIKGKEREEVGVLRTGEIGALVKLKETKTSDTLTTPELNIKLPPIKFPEPSISIAIVPKTRGDEEKVSNGLHRLHNEDPTFTFYYATELKQQIISGLGELHLDVILGRLKRKFDVAVDIQKPKIPYRETITKKAEAQGKYKKQTGGRGQYGDVWLRIEPLPRGKGFEFADEIFGGAIPAKYIPSIEKGVREAMEQGFLANYPITDLKVTVYDGSFHPVDSSDIAFKIAAIMSFRNACEKAGVILLEPIMELEVSCPDQFLGEVMGDLNARRGRILGIERQGNLQVVKAHCPLAELYKYSTTLRSITQGRGYFTMKFAFYEEVPKELSAKIIEEAKREKEKEKE